MSCFFFMLCTEGFIYNIKWNAKPLKPLKPFVFKLLRMLTKPYISKVMTCITGKVSV